MAIPSIKQKLFKFLFYKDVAIKIQIFNSFSCRVFPTGEYQSSPPSRSVHPSSLAIYGGGRGEPPTKFSKRKDLTGPQLLEGVAGKERGFSIKGG